MKKKAQDIDREAELRSWEPSDDADVQVRRSAAGFRLGLGTLVLWITILGLVMANGFTIRRLRRAEAERDALRNQVGYLNVADASVLAAVQIATTEPLVWKYRVQVPARGRFRFAYGTKWPAERGRPRWISAVSMPPGESIVLVRVMQDPRDAVWKLVCLLQQGEMTLRQATPLSARQTELFRSSTDTFRVGVGQETQTASEDETLMVIDQRWLAGESGLLMYGAGPPEADVDGIFGALQADEGALNP